MNQLWDTGSNWRPEPIHACLELLPGQTRSLQTQPPGCQGNVIILVKALAFFL
jgi:hypothetical protein